MLELKNVKKSYTTGDFTQHALNGVSVKFRENEFVAVLGQSGSGKTTLLNIIGGLDRYDSGDLVINGRSTEHFKAVDWDAYRNNSVGFIFQSYNLIGHISVLANVEMSMTLSGVTSAERRRRAAEVLERVGLKNHAKKKPNQLSGGQMQRVAIARALVNNPDVILADEPTGALDTATSAQIMDLISEIARDKLVIMVTHNPAIAEKYANRIIKIEDGVITDDSNPVRGDEADGGAYKPKKTSMSFFTALKLSFNNILTKKGRTLLTAFASSIGIIGIALILALSNGFDMQIQDFEADTMGSFPIMISREAIDMTEEELAEMRTSSMNVLTADYPDEPFAYPYNADENKRTHTNKINGEFVDYVEKIDPDSIMGLLYTYITGVNIIGESDGEVKLFGGGFSMANMSGAASLSGEVVNKVVFSCIPKTLDGGEGLLHTDYDLLAGSYPEEPTDVVVVVATNNRISTELAKALGCRGDEEEVPFTDFLGRTFKYIPNDIYYTPFDMPTAAGETVSMYIARSDYAAMYEEEGAVTLTVTGVVRLSEESVLSILSPGVAYTNEFLEYVLDDAASSEIGIAQTGADYNVMSGDPIDRSTEEGAEAYAQVMSYIGAAAEPYIISIFPSDFDEKESVIDYLAAYNEGKSDDELIIYNDLAETISSLSGDIMNAISIVLIAFSSISLVVSVIMIAIITYVSVLERTKEIGVLRSLGARSKDISRIFNAETFIIGAASGLLGILIARLLVFPTNLIIENATNLGNVAQMNPLHALFLIVVSVSLTVLGGAIPAVMASKRDPVIALRTE